MTIGLSAAVASLAWALVVGLLVPSWAMKRLLPSLEAGGRRVTNYRGRGIPSGLGIAWLVWAVGVAASNAAIYYLPLNDDRLVEALYSAPVIQMFGLPAAILVAGAMAFGMVDDQFGDSSAKGFRGHLAGLAQGRLTTGGLKLLGIGGLAIVGGYFAGQQIAGPDMGTPTSWFTGLASWALAALVIALSANLVNLTDLRPGRALKTYLGLTTLAMLISVWSVWLGGSDASGALSPELFSVGRIVWIGFTKLAIVAVAWGPVFAVWRYDLGERAMLGDAGANAMGALAGLMLVWRAPLWLLAVLFVVMLALNLASERVSFSTVIERVGWLKWIDGLGRLPSDGSGTEAVLHAPLGADAGDKQDGE